MEAKKNRKYRLESKRGLFFSIGLVISFSIVISAFEWNYSPKVEMVEKEQVVTKLDAIVPVTEIPEPEPAKPKVFASEFVEVEEIDELEIEDFDIVIDQDEVIEVEASETAFREEEIELEEEVDEVFLYVEQMPEPAGGYAEFYKFLSENIEYPGVARRIGVEGKVFVQFIVNEQGKIVEPLVVKGIGGGCDEEALRVLKICPIWIPGNQRGKNVKVRMVVPVHFILNKSGV